MAESRLRLTQQLHQQIVASIRSGGYPHVACEAWGIPRVLFDEWLRKGDDVRARPPYLTFARDVRQAIAQARLRAEMAVFQDDARAWLEHGPGRERNDCPGWSVSVKPADPVRERDNSLLDPEIMRAFRLVLDALAPFPEARAEVAKKLLPITDGEDEGTLETKPTTESKPTADIRATCDVTATADRNDGPAS